MVAGSVAVAAAVGFAGSWGGPRLGAIPVFALCVALVGVDPGVVVAHRTLL
jgi:hypothetical protein